MNIAAPLQTFCFCYFHFSLRALKASKPFQNSYFLRRCFSTGVPRNLRVLLVAAKGSAETDQNCLDEIRNHSSKRF